MVHKFLFFQHGSDALEFSNLFGVVEKDAVGTDIEVIEAALAQFTGELCLVTTIELLDMQNEFVEIERVVVELSQFDLPGADLLDVIEDMFQLVKINQCAFDFIEVHLLDFRTARNISKQPRQRASAMRAPFISETAINEITGAITQDDAAARVERSENNFTRRARWQDFAGLRIDDFDERQIGIEVVAAGRLVVRVRAFGPGLFGFGEAVSGKNIDIGSAQLASKVAEFQAKAVADFLTREHDVPQILAMHTLIGSLCQQVVDESRNADQDIGFKFADVAEVAFGAHDFAAAGTQRH